MKSENDRRDFEAYLSALLHCLGPYSTHCDCCDRCELFGVSWRGGGEVKSWWPFDIMKSIARKAKLRENRQAHTRERAGSAGSGKREAGWHGCRNIRPS